MLQGDSVHSSDMALEKAASNASNAKGTGKEKNDDIMSVLLAHEKQNTSGLVLPYITYLKNNLCRN